IVPLGRPAPAAPTNGAPRPRASQAPAARELRVTVINGARGAAEGEVVLRAPAGWIVDPPAAPVRFTREDEARTVRVRLRPPAGVAPGAYTVRAVVRSGDREFDRGYQVVEYPHVRRRHLVHEAAATVRVLDVAGVPGLSVGYVMGVGDEVPAAIEQLGGRVTLLGPEDLAWGDLSRFDVIVTGVRAYERRADLRASNDRLLEYVRRGGTLIVQYNKFEFNEAQYGPYPARVSSQRVTDERSPVRVLEPSHPVFTTPNRITGRTWDGWVQERGLYFLGDRDPRYRDLLELEDPFEYNAGPRRGALVEATVGTGRWIYVGLGLWRQLPAGTPGAYELLANLLALGRSSRR
ncbi:MAG TPA: NEW3 domain-containing protein, partial [Vicinamibacterales bacterium]|nr:NEW3 domain-containing protein [Vicinamibacterales bacterium]